MCAIFISDLELLWQHNLSKHNNSQLFKKKKKKMTCWKRLTLSIKNFERPARASTLRTALNVKEA